MKTRGARLAGEAILIVLSILFAFSIDAWWAQRQEWKRVQSVLAGVSDGLEASSSAIEATLATATSDAELLRRWISMTPAEVEQIPRDSAFSFIRSIFRPNTSEDGLEGLSRQLEDPGIVNLRHPGLADAIADWRNWVYEAEELGRVAVTDQSEALRLLARYPAVTEVFALPRPAEGEIAGGPMRTIREDPEILGVAGRRVMVLRLQLRSGARLLESTDALRASVDDVRTR